MIGTFSKSGADRMVVRISKVVHNNAELGVSGLVVTPDTMETAVASRHRPALRRAVRVAGCCGFRPGRRSGGGDEQYHDDEHGLWHAIRDGADDLDARRVHGLRRGGAGDGRELAQNTPKGPNIHLDANVGVGVVFLADVEAP